MLLFRLIVHLMQFMGVFLFFFDWGQRHLFLGRCLNYFPMNKKSNSFSPSVSGDPCSPVSRAQRCCPCCSCSKFLNRVSFDGGHHLHKSSVTSDAGGGCRCTRGGESAAETSNAVDEWLSSCSPLHCNHLEVVWIDTSIISVRMEWWLMPWGKQVEGLPLPPPSDSPASNLYSLLSCLIFFT